MWRPELRFLIVFHSRTNSGETDRPHAAYTRSDEINSVQPTARHALTVTTAAEVNDISQDVHRLDFTTIAPLYEQI